MSAEAVIARLLENHPKGFDLSLDPLLDLLDKLGNAVNGAVANNRLPRFRVHPALLFRVVVRVCTIEKVVHLLAHPLEGLKHSENTANNSLQYFWAKD